VDLSELIISATKPRGKPARLLRELGFTVRPVEEDEGNVDRYLLSERLAVERRTGSGFLRGVTDKTLFTSAIYLREHYAMPILIVEGEVNYEYTRFDPQAVRGALSSMMLSYGLSVLSSPTLEDTVALIAMMARQEQVGIPEISLIPKRKATDLADMQRRLIEMLPGCGRVMARDLLQHFGSVARVLQATEEELRGVRGVGAKRAAEIHRVLNAEYESLDTERDLEEAIAAAPELLFGRPTALLARQHGITAGEARHVVDLVFLDPEAEELILVEVKRGRLRQEHCQQLRRYLDSAHESRLLRSFLGKGVSIRGVLVTAEAGEFRPRDPAVSVHIVDPRQAIEVLKRIRSARFAGAAS
jgi:ERCC4-type nuclease